MGVAAPAHGRAGSAYSYARMRAAPALSTAVLVLACLAGSSVALAERIGGSARGEKLTGTRGADTLLGRGGNDVLRGRRGNDRVLGGAGSDSVIGGPGADRLVGGPGSDEFNAREGVHGGAQGNDRINARDGKEDLVNCGPGRDIAIVDASEDGVFDCEVVREP